MFTFNCRGRLIVVDNPWVMGIVNITPDSFFEGSRFSNDNALLQMVEKMLNDGAACIDVGGQSTRPHSGHVGEEEELLRIIDTIAAIHRRFPDALISVDTFYSRVAREAVAGGAVIVNDVSGASMDEEMLTTVASLSVPYVCMHTRGTPSTMHQFAVYDNVVTDVLDYFVQKVAACRVAGIRDIIVDPGFGFAKTASQNFQLLRNLRAFHMLDCPVMAGLSRKSTVYKTLGVTAADALNGSTVLHTIALLNGAHILRVHDVREAMEAIRLVSAYAKALE